MTTKLFRESLSEPGWVSYGERYEADCKPIQQELLKLEKVKTQKPELAVGSGQLLGEMIIKVDNLLGLNRKLDS